MALGVFPLRKQVISGWLLAAAGGERGRLLGLIQNGLARRCEVSSLVCLCRFAGLYIVKSIPGISGVVLVLSLRDLRSVRASLSLCLITPSNLPPHFEQASSLRSPG